MVDTDNEEVKWKMDAVMMVRISRPIARCARWHPWTRCSEGSDEPSRRLPRGGVSRVGERRAEAEVPRAVTAMGGRGMLVTPCMPRHASGVSLTLGCPPVHEESRVHGSGDGLHRRELHGVWRGGGAYRGRVRVQAVQRLLLQRCNLLGVTCSIRRSRRTSSSDCTSSLWRKSSGCSRASCLKSACRKKSECVHCAR